MRNSRTIRVVFAAVVIALPSMASAQTLRNNLTQRIDTFDSYNTSPVGQLIDLAQTLGVSVGIEWLDIPDEKSSPPVHLRKTTLRNVLQRILAPYPGYSFDLTNGVIHVFSTALVRDKKNFLNIRFAQFRLERVNLFQASYELTNALRDVIQPRSGYGGGTGYGRNPSTGFDVRNINLFAKNSTARTILDLIAAKQGNALWVVRLKQNQMMDNGRFYAQTVSTVSKEAAPDFHWEFIPLKDLKK